MAEAFNFYGANMHFKAPPGMADCIDLPVHAGAREYISCWRLTPEEIAHITRTGEVWLSVAGDTHPPVSVSGLPRMTAVSPVSGGPLIYRSDGMHVVPEAREYAISMHGDQPYGPYTHEYHLGEVADFLAKLGYGWVYLTSAWLHDVVEDTEPDKTPEQRLNAIVFGFGDTVGKMVWAVTGIKWIDGVKQNRKQCNAQMYAKIAAFPEAAPLKGGDRYANMKACLDFDDEDKAGMYLKEHPEFMENVGIYLDGIMIGYLNQIRDQLFERFPKLATKYKDKA